MTPLLSIIVISHEQREELRRCLDSILAMQLPFAHEIIVSDDRSTDGTREMLNELTSERVREFENERCKLVVTYCNSDEGNCANNSQRSGYNRCNAYKLAKGKYIAFVDADDYFEEGTKVYEHQVAMLESHPDCALCMANMKVLTIRGEEHRTHMWNKQMTEGEVLSPQQYLVGNRFIQNQAFVVRNVRTEDPTEIYGNRFVDAIITCHYLQYGNIVCVDDYGYVYVRHEQSVSDEITKRIDGWVVYCKGIYIPLLIPKWRDYLYKAELPLIYKVVKYALAGEQLEEKNMRHLRGMHVYVYDCFNRKLEINDYCRLGMARLVLWWAISKKRYNARIGNMLERLLIKEVE